VRKHEGMKGYARSAGFPFPGIGGWPAGVWLLAGAASMALGIWADMGSVMIALFVLLAGLYFHRFWTIQDDLQRQNLAGNFYRNVALLGASLALWASSSQPMMPFASRSPVRCSERHPSDERRHPCSTAPGWATAGRSSLAASRSLREG
jgi:hypothetical protein